MENKQNIPSLRFPEFDGTWEKKTLSEVVNKITDGTHDTPKPTSEGVPFLTAIHIKDGFVDYDNCYYLDQEVHNSIYKRCNPEKDDLLIVNIGAGTATCAINSVDYEFSLKNVALVKPNKEILDGKFLAQTQRKKASKIFNQLTSGGAQPFLSLKEIGKLKISYPIIPEQTKIANFLTSVDEKLQALKQKKNLLEKYKIGVMQRIFSQKMQFKDDNGNDFEDWKEKKLGDIGETYNGLTGKTKEHFGIGKPYIQYKQIFDDSKIDISRFELVSISPTEKQNKVLFGDVFFTVSSETPNEIGTASVLLDNIEELYLNSFCFGFRPNSIETLNPYYSRYLFRSELFRNEIVKLAQGSTRFNMSKVQLMKLEVKLPCNQEQTKIANFLSAIDDKINHCQSQIEKMEVWKKGLLQQMFV